MATCDSLDVDLSRIDLTIEPEQQHIDVDVVQAEITIAAGIIAGSGPKGDAATIAVGSTTTGIPGSAANVVNVGNQHDAIFNFTIPTGAAGQPGSPGTKGDAGPPGSQGNPGIPAYTTSTSGFTVPSIGSTVTVPVIDTSWAMQGEVVWVRGAGAGGPTTSGVMQIVGMTSTSLTLLNI